MKTIDVQQGSADWLEARAGIPTASELCNLITEKFALRKTDTGMVQTYLATKLAEKWLGGPLPSFSGGVLEQGSILEDEARPRVELLLNTDIKQVGLLTTDDGSFGCSPDGLFADGRGLELKCPQPVNHVKWLLEGECPSEHVLQCQGGMLVTGANEWVFASYCRGFPTLLTTVKRDPEVQTVIGLGLAAFGMLLDAAYAEIVARNGGKEPKRRPQPDPDTVSFVHPF